MSLDLVEKFKELSVSSQFRPIFQNKRPLNVCYNIDEYLHFESSTYSSRIFLNYKDMNNMGLKAGSLIRIYHKGSIYFLVRLYLFYRIDDFEYFGGLAKCYNKVEWYI